MQVILESSLSEYIANDYGKNTYVLRPHRCLNPKCGIPIPPKKHGGYERYVISEEYGGLIYIHRFYCPHCGMTFSYLPSFCIPYFQYALQVIFDILYHCFRKGLSFLNVLNFLQHIQNFSILSISHISFYCRRFMKNIPWIQMGIRCVSRMVELSSEDGEKRKKARELIDSITDNFSIHTFSQRFFEHCRRSFLASFAN